MHVPRHGVLALALLSMATAACGETEGWGVVAAPVAPPCGPGTMWNGSQCVVRPAQAPVERQVAVGSDGDEAGQDTGRTAVAAAALDPALFRDQRRRPARARALVVVEIQQLESLFRATSVASPDRPMLLRRLAEDYVELEKEAGNAPPIRERARKEAIRYYATLLAEYSGQPSPTFPSSPPPAYAQLDEAAYYLAYEHEQAGDLPNARRAYYELITRSPGSRLVPRAYLAFGELFAAEAASDPTKWQLAQAAFTKVVATPPPANDVYGYAWYRLGHVFVSEGDRARAADAFHKAVDFAAAFPQLPGSQALGAEAQGQMRALSP
jgi:tetratricopeptide (TPR) repeat protein